MLFLSGFELNSGWVPLIVSVKKYMEKIVISLFYFVLKRFMLFFLFNNMLYIFFN